MLSLQTCYVTSWHTFYLCFPTQVSILLDSLCTLRIYFDLLPSLCASPPLFPSLFFICPPPCCLWHGPSHFGTIPAARFPSLHLSPSLAAIFCIVQVLLRKTRRISTQGYTVTHTHRVHVHTHTHTRASSDKMLPATK